MKDNRDIVLSIKPEYANAIIEGRKKVEFRKTIFKEYIGKRIFIYSSSPVKKIVGWFYVREIIKKDPIALWDFYGEYGCISKYDFFQYYKNCSIGSALKIKTIYKLKKQIKPNEYIENFHAPQSYHYISKEFIKDIISGCVNDDTISDFYEYKDF